MENKENLPRSRIPVLVRGLRKNLPLKIYAPVKTVRSPLKTIGTTNQCQNTAGPSRTTQDASQSTSSHTTHTTTHDHSHKPIKVLKKGPVSPPPFQRSPPDVPTVKKAENSPQRCLQESTPKTLTKEDKHEVKCEKKSREFLDGVRMDELNHNYTGDTMKYLLREESKVYSEPVITRPTRSCIINWIVRVDVRNNNPAVIQSACFHFDRHLSFGLVEIMSLQLTAAACYWLASKYHGYRISGQRLSKCSNYAFQANELKKTEMRVLHKSRYSKQPVIPNDFIPFLCWWSDPTKVDLLESAASFICLSGMVVSTRLCTEYPSVIAAVCVRIALVLLEKGELIVRLESCPVYKEASKKAIDLLATYAHVRDCVRTCVSSNYEYTAHVDKYSKAPNNIAPTIIKAFKKGKISINSYLF